jgi:hypothetical protein
MKVILHRETLEAGEGPNGPRKMAVFTFELRRFALVDKGKIKIEEEQKTLPMPYIIWPSHEHGRVRYRWARRHRGKPEMRLGITTHGAQETLGDAIVACLENHAQRQLCKGA